MYESPIQVYVNNMLEQMSQNEENQIVAEVSQAVGINVEKEELIKALQYDRNQYEKGYKDAMRRKEGEWIKTYEPNDAEPFILWKCEICGLSERIKTRYCPNCGAKMEVEE